MPVILHLGGCGLGILQGVMRFAIARLAVATGFGNLETWQKFAVERCDARPGFAQAVEGVSLPDPNGLRLVALSFRPFGGFRVPAICVG